MSDQYNGPGFHLSLANENHRPPKLSARDRRFQAQQSAELERWIEANWVPCVKCQQKHPPQHGSHCIICAMGVPEAEQRSAVRVGPRKS